MKPAMALTLLLATVLLAACDQPQMERQRKYETYEEADGWPQNQSARLPVPGTVARDDPLQTPAAPKPKTITRTLLEHGQERFEIFCAPCHGRDGYGDGMVVQRGFPDPPSFHSTRLRNAPLAHFYEVISNGYGVMYSYAARVPPSDRWAIATYIQALQLSQHAPADDLTPAQRDDLEARQ